MGTSTDHNGSRPGSSIPDFCTAVTAAAFLQMVKVREERNPIKSRLLYYYFLPSTSSTSLTWPDTGDNICSTSRMGEQCSGGGFDSTCVHFGYCIL